MSKSFNFLQSFNPSGTSTEILEKTLIGRKEVVDRLIDLVIESTTSGNKFQNIIIGPRGSGKTHMLKVIHSKLYKDTALRDKLVIAYLNEDEYGVATYLDWIIRILRSIMKWYQADATNLDKEIAQLKIIPVTEQEKFAVNILLKYIKGRTLLILVENLENIFSSKKGFGENGQSKFRDLIQQNPYFTIIASNQSLFKYIQKEDKPFHNFFKIIHLKKLTLDEAIQLLTEIVKIDECPDLIKFLRTPEGIGKMKAIYDLIGGNHRLLVTFYQFLRSDYKHNLSQVFIKTINDLIPYYQSMMDLLSAQQQKVIQYLCQERVPQNVKSIAENCYAASNTISKQLNILEKLNYVDAINKNIGKETFYELKEPLLRICNEIKENHDGPVRLFIDFLGNLYTVKELKEKFFIYSIRSGVKDNAELSIFKKELPYFEEALKKYHPELYKDLDIGEIKNYDQDEIINIYIKDLKKSKSHAEIINLAEQISPKNKRLILEEAEALEEIGDIEKEIEILKNYESKNPNDIEVLFKLSKAFEIEKKFDDELLILDRILGLEKKNTKASVKKSICLIDLNRYSEAEDILQNITLLKPKHPSAWTLLGESQYRQKKDKDAINSFLKALEIDPDDWYSLSQLSIYMLKKEDYKKAEEYSTKLTNLRPESPLSWTLLGDTQNNLNKLVEAEASFRKAYDLDNNNTEALLKLGLFLIKNENYNEAEIYFSKLVELSSNNDQYLRLLATAQLNLDRITEALTNFKKAYELNRNDFMSLGFIGLIYGAQNDYKRQEKYFRKVLTLAPQNYLACEYLGYAQLKLNKYNEAIKSYTKSIELNKDNAEAYIGLITIYLLKNENSKAMLEIQNFQEKFSYDVNIINELGNNLIDYHIYSEAIPLFKEVAKKEKFNLFPYHNMTLCYLGLNQIKLALNCFTKSINFETDQENSESFISSINEYLDILLDSDIIVIKEFLDYAFKEFAKRKLMANIYKEFPSMIFNLLAGYQLIPSSKLELMQQILVNNFSDTPEMKIPLKYLDVGIRYLIKKEKNVLLKLTKEERNTFKKFVLLNNNTSKKDIIDKPI